MSIKIDIPGVGRVDVEGAAEERTMQEILKAVEARNKAEGIQTKEVNEALKELGENAKDAAGDLKEVGQAADSLTKGFGSFGKSLAATAANIAVSFIKAYDTMADKPIQAGAALMQATIDLSAQMLKLGIDTLVKAGKGASAILGPWAGGVQATADAVGKFGKDIVDLGEQVATLGNQFLAAEFEKRINALANFTKVGASFAGGMAEMGTLANESGIGLANFAQAVGNSRDQITDMGLSAGTAAELVSKSLKGLANTTGKSGSKLREELLALGFAYEVQGEVSASYIAQQRRAGVSLQALQSNQEALAIGTYEYGKKLKLVSDITGQDAKKVMERAQAEAQRGMLLSKLQGNQRTAFEDSYAALTRFGPKVQAAFTQYYATGAFGKNNKAVAVQTEFVDMIKKLTADVQAGRANMTQVTAGYMADVGTEMKGAGSKFSELADIAAGSGVTGLPSEIAELRNQALAYLLPASEAEKSAKSIEGQATATDDLTKGYQTATAELTNFSNKMEKLAGEALPTYAKVISENTERAAKVMGIAIDYLTGKIKNLTDLGYALYNDTGPAGQAGSGPNDLTGLPGDKRTNAEKAQADAEVKAGKKSYNALGFDQPNVDPYEIAAAKVSKAKEADRIKKLEDMDRAELKARDTALKAEMLNIISTKENSAKDRADHQARIKEINRDTANIYKIQQQKGWMEPDLPTRATPKANPTPGKAKGGISTGPLSGYQETLHGTEAVVPLPDNKSIPVTLDSSSLNKQIAHQTSVLNEILVAMRDGNKYASGLLRNSY